VQDAFAEVADLRSKIADAQARGSALMHDLRAAQEADLEAAATAIRSGDAATKPTAAKIEKAIAENEQEIDVFRAALAQADSDLVQALAADREHATAKAEEDMDAALTIAIETIAAPNEAAAKLQAALDQRLYVVLATDGRAPYGRAQSIVTDMKKPNGTRSALSRRSRKL